MSPVWPQAVNLHEESLKQTYENLKALKKQKEADGYDTSSKLNPYA